MGHLIAPTYAGSPSSRRAWIEILRIHYFVSGKPSPSSQRAWIEIVCRRPRLKAVIVALLAEGVDRNLRPAVEDHIDEVALLAEGVDRNIQLRRSVLIPASSPSSQRAWIEMHL